MVAIINGLKNEIEYLNDFKSLIFPLDDNVGISDEVIREVLFKIYLRIMQCKICIRELEQADAYCNNISPEESTGRN